LIQNSFQQALANKIIQYHCQVEFKNTGSKPQIIKIRKLNYWSSLCYKFLWINIL